MWKKHKIWTNIKGDYERVSFYVAKIYQECRINTIAIFLTDSSRMTLPVGLTNFQSMYSTDYVGMIAAVIITIIPSVVVYILLHKQIMEGMVAGAVKG